MARDSNQLTEEEFERWEPVREVVAFVRTVQPFLYQDTIKARVRSGSLRSAAKRIAELDHDGDLTGERRRCIFIPGWINDPDQRFWELGDHTVKVRRDPTGYAGLRVSAEIEGVRFHPDDVDELRRDLGLKPKAVTAGHQKSLTASEILEGVRASTTVEALSNFMLASGDAQPASTPLAALLDEGRPDPPFREYVPEPEVIRWFEALPAADQRRGWRWLWPQARQRFAPLQVYKKHVLQFVKDRDRGRPKKCSE
jgi:hypothetical protein